MDMAALYIWVGEQMSLLLTLFVVVISFEWLVEVGVGVIVDDPVAAAADVVVVVVIVGSAAAAVTRAKPQYIPQGNASNSISQFKSSRDILAVGIPRSLLPRPNPGMILLVRRMGRRRDVVVVAFCIVSFLVPLLTMEFSIGVVVVLLSSVG